MWVRPTLPFSPNFHLLYEEAILDLGKLATPGDPGCSIWGYERKRRLRTFLEGSLPPPHANIAQKLSWPIRGSSKVQYITKHRVGGLCFFIFLVF